MHSGGFDIQQQCQPWINKPLGPRLFNWEGTIKKVSDSDYWRSTLINKQWFINPGLTLLTTAII